MLELISPDGQIDHPVQALGLLIAAAAAAGIVAWAGLRLILVDPGRVWPGRLRNEVLRPETLATLMICVLAGLQYLHHAGRENLVLFRPEIGDGGLVEHATVLLLLTPALVLAFDRFVARRPGRVRLPIAVLAALAGIILAGEELSWGQHILGFAPPEPIRATNLQEEFNLHNYITPQTMEMLYLGAAAVGLLIAGVLNTLLAPSARTPQRLALKALIAAGAVLMAHHIFQEVAELAVVLAGAWIYILINTGRLQLAGPRALGALVLRPA